METASARRSPAPLWKPFWGAETIEAGWDLTTPIRDMGASLNGDHHGTRKTDQAAPLVDADTDDPQNPVS